MTLTIPDIQNITNGTNGYDLQTVIDGVDINAAVQADGGNGVISGCLVSAQASPNMTVQTSAGTVLINGLVVVVAADTSITIVAADASDRRDIIVVNSSAVVSAVKGTDCGTAGWTRTTTNALPPIKPSIPANSVILGEVAVTSTTTSIAAANIVDKTTTVSASPGTLLDRASFAPSSVTTYTLVAAATGVTALDTTNLKVNFVGPPSGKVLVKLTALVEGTTAATKFVYFAVVSSTGSPGTLVGVVALVYSTPTTTALNDESSVTTEQLISVTAGISYTWYFAASTTTTSTCKVLAQGGTANTSTPTGGPATISVWAA